MCFKKYVVVKHLLLTRTITYIKKYLLVGIGEMHNLRKLSDEENKTKEHSCQ